jgi:DNA (cytosine-5)-methyltransferase 1
MNYIDLFAGASGMSEGFKRSGFNPVAHIEMNQEACNTIRTRVAYHYLKSINKLETYYEYIGNKIQSREQFYAEIPQEQLDSVINAEITDLNISSLFTQIQSLLKSQKEDKIDLIIGGPPCQAYSLIGRHKESIEKDKRNFLFVQYGKFLKEYSPKAFVFENVPGLLSANKGLHFENMKKYFRKIGYEIYVEILDASDYGVLQSRRRVIIVGWKKEFDFGFPVISKHEKIWTIDDIFSDLTELKPGETKMITPYKTEINEYLKKYEIRNGIDFVTHNIARQHNKNDLEIYKIAIEKWNNENIRLKYTDLPERLITHKNTKSFLDRFKVVDKAGVSHTIVAHIAKDGHHYIHPDSEQCRSLSVREAARIQSFPDDFYFEGSRTAAFTQIGNAVPPLMSYAIAQKMKELLCQIKK